jgi:aspartyl-tRNA(Asn)/glutamyl-tRNA(Gln) amidotransferase subunit A
MTVSLQHDLPVEKKIMDIILKLGRMLRDREISCVELTREYLDLAKRTNPTLCAYITITEDVALAAAAEADEKFDVGGELSPLLGIPFVLKDNIATKGIRTTCASKMLENHVPIFDGATWEYLREHGAVLIGKGNMDEMAMGSAGSTSYFGQALNPRDTSRVPGGSSGGVAVAVASGTAAFGIGTDTGGSIRQPASFCGLVGLKPTYGAVSRHGLFPLASSLDQIGPITTSVRDAAIVLDAISVNDKRDVTNLGLKPMSEMLSGDIKGTKIGILKECYDNLTPDVEKAMQDALKTYEKMGATLVDLRFPLLQFGIQAYIVLSTVDAASNLGRFDGIRFGYRTEKYDDADDLICKTRSEGFGDKVKRRIILGTYLSSAEQYNKYFDKVLLLKNAIRNEYKRVFDSCDYVVTPTLPHTAGKVGAKPTVRDNFEDINNVSVNIAGLPAVSIPCGFDECGLPIGLQVIAKKFCDDVVLNAALAFETETDGAFLKDIEGGVAF